MLLYWLSVGLFFTAYSLLFSHLFGLLLSRKYRHVGIFGIGKGLETYYKCPEHMEVTVLEKSRPPKFSRRNYETYNRYGGWLNFFCMLSLCDLVFISFNLLAYQLEFSLLFTQIVGVLRLVILLAMFPLGHPLLFESFC